MKIIFKDASDNQLVLMNVDFVCYLDSLFKNEDYIPKGFDLNTSGIMFTMNDYDGESQTTVYVPNLFPFEAECLIQELFEKDKLDLTSYYLSCIFKFRGG